MRKTVLLVDDDEDIIALLRSFLNADYNILQAGYVSDALFTLQKEHVDFVITDYFMSPRNGVYLIREIRKTNKAIPIFIISGYCLDDIEPEIEGLDVAGIFPKPLSKDTFLDKLSQLLSPSK